MKLKDNIDIKDFLEKVAACSGEVIFKAKDIDSLNLKSLLSGLVFSSARGEGRFMENGEIICENAADYKILGPFLIP